MPKDNQANLARNEFPARGRGLYPAVDNVACARGWRRWRGMCELYLVDALEARAEEFSMTEDQRV